MLSRLKPLRHKVEGLVGLPLLDLTRKIEMKQSKLVGPKRVYLPKTGIFMSYYERRPTSMKDTTQNKQVGGHAPYACPAPTLLLCHGIGTSAYEFCSLLKNMDIPNHVRVLVPEHIGHGQDLERAKMTTPDDFAYPSPNDLLESTSEFLDVVLREGTRCNALGTSLGGALLYFLRARRPETIQNTVLVAPAIPSVLQTPFVNGLADGSNPFLEFESRDDVKQLMRNYLWTDPSKRHKFNDETSADGGAKDPIPTIFYEAMYRASLRDVPRGHYQKLQDTLLDVAYSLHEDRSAKDVPNYTTAGAKDNGEPNTNMFSASSDLDPDCRRLLIWPEEDQISDVVKGRAFFKNSLQAGTTKLETIPDCGHMFAADQKLLYDLIAPKVRDFLLDFSNPETVLATAALQ